MILDLIAKIAGPNGSAGPLVIDGGSAIPIREWLCDALVPMGSSYPRRMALAHRVRQEMEEAGPLPQNPAAAEREIDAEVRTRVRASGKTTVRRAVSDHVRARKRKRHEPGQPPVQPNR